MPTVSIRTNVPASKIPADFLDNSVGIVSKAFGSPKSVVQIIPDQMINWRDSEGPCALVDVMSIGKIGPVENKKYSSTFSEWLLKELGIPADRIYFMFTDYDKHYVGHKATTFADLL